MRKLSLITLLLLLISFCLNAQKSIGIHFGPVFQRINKFNYKPFLENGGEFVGINIETFSKKKFVLHSGISYMERLSYLRCIFPAYSTSMRASSIVIGNGIKYYINEKNRNILFYVNINSLFNFHLVEGYSAYVGQQPVFYVCNDFKLYNFILSTGAGVNVKISERFFSKFELNFGMPLWRTKNNFDDFLGLVGKQSIQHPPILHNNLVIGLSYKFKKR